MLLTLSLLMLVVLPAASAYPQVWPLTARPLGGPRLGGPGLGGPDIAQWMQRFTQRSRGPFLGTSTAPYKGNGRRSQRLRVPFLGMSTSPNEGKGRRSQYSAISQEGSDPREVELWFDRLPQDDDMATETEATALKDFLAGRKPVDEAAKELTSAAATSRAEEDLARLWGFITDAALALPDQQDKLIELLTAIKRLPPGGAVDWSRLPGFASDIRDRWDVPEDDPLRPEYTKLNIWAARITKSGLVDLKHMAIWSLREALESQPAPNVKLDALVPGAAQWMIQAGRLVSRSQGVTGPEGRAGPLFEGRPGFSEERWIFWKGRFRWIQVQERLQAQTKELAKRAEQAMDYAE